MKPEDAFTQRKAALRFLLEGPDSQFVRTREWRPRAESDIELGVWTPLYEAGLIDWYVPGGDHFQLTVKGWIEACKLLRKEVGLDRRFGLLSAHLKRLNEARDQAYASTTTHEIATATGLPEQWVFDAIDGKMAENIFHRHGAQLASRMGDVDIPAHIGNELS
jgi:hypothetical protein